MKLNDLREHRAKNVAEMRKLADAAEAANREMDEAEAKRFADLMGEAEKLETRIANAERLADFERRAAATPVTEHAEFSREVRNYSLAKAMQEFLAGALTGREREVQTELAKGANNVRGLLVPTDIILPTERRDGQTTAPDTAGGYLVKNQLASMQDRFRPALKVQAMGATVVSGLTGPLDLPALASSATAYWVGENGNTTRSAAGFEKKTMSPKTCSGEMRISRRLLLQSSESIEGILRTDLQTVLATEMDRAFINGSGVGAEPLGVLNEIGLDETTVTGTMPEWIADMIGQLDDVNAPEATRAFLTNSAVMTKARKVLDQNDMPIPLATTFHGYPVEVSNNVPATIDTNKSALIFGAWSQLYLGYWSAIDILLNPYHADVASNGGVLLHAFIDVDSLVRNIDAFTYAKVA